MTVCVLSLMLSPSASATAVDPRVSTQPPLDLPGDKATGFRAHKGTWIVAGRRGRTTSAIAKRFHTRPIASHLGVFEVSIADARAFAAELRGRGLLAFAEPNVVRQRQDKPTEPLSGSSDSWWRSAVVSPEVVAPAIAANSPLLGVIDSQIDLTHPEFAGGGVTALYDTAVDHWHGTAVTAVAAAPINGTGIAGVWPGMRVTEAGYDSTCAGSARAIRDVVKAGATTINMSYGGTSPCFAEYIATQAAVRAGVVLVAAGPQRFHRRQSHHFPVELPACHQRRCCR